MDKVTAIDWRKLEAGEQLDRIVFNRLGNTIVRVEDPSGSYWEALDKNGESLDVTFSPKTESAAFARMQWDPECIGSFHYSSNMNEAIQLLALMPLGAVGISEDEKTWFSNSYMDGFGVLSHEEAASPELAIVRAYLAYREWEQESKTPPAE